MHFHGFGAITCPSLLNSRRAARWIVLGTWTLGIVVAQGCGSDSGRPRVVPVSGRILFAGKPVEGATVAFATEGSPRVASGTTDADGRFKLTTFDTNDGAPVGDHAITITKLKASQDAAPPVNLDNPGDAYTKMMTDSAAGKTPEADSELPQKYADPKESGLRRTVTAEGPNEFTIELE